jgi:hypothetical protein
VIEVHEATGRTGAGVTIRCRTSCAPAGLARCLDLALRIGHRRVLVDLDGGESASSALLAVLRRARLRLRAQGGRLEVTCSDPRLRRLLDAALRQDRGERIATAS